MDPLEQESGEAMDWNGLLRNVYYRALLTMRQLWWVPLMVVTGFALFAAYKSLQKPVVYHSKARMHVGPQVAIPDSGLYREELTSFYGTQLEFMRSSRVKQGAHERVRTLYPHLIKGSVSLRAFRTPETSLFELSANGSEAEYTQMFLDAVMAEYMEFRSDMRAQTAQDTYLRISNELSRFEVEINQLEDRIVEYQRSNNVVFLEEQVGLASSLITQLTRERAELSSELKTISTVPLEQQLTQTVVASSGTARDFLPGNQAYLDARAGLDQARAERDAYAAHLRPQHPKMIGFQNEIDRMERIVSILKDQAEEKVDLRKKALEIRIQNIDTEVEDWERQSLDYNQRLAAFKKLESELSLAQRNYDRLAQSLESIDLNQNIQQDTVNVLEKASKARAERADVRRDTVKGVLMGVFVTVAIWVAWGFLDNRVLNTEDLEKNFDLNIMGVIPDEKVRRGESITLLHEGVHRPIFVEAMRNLRSSILFMDHSGGVMRPQMFLIASSVPNEGKSTVSSNIAVAMAMAHSKTLIIDADLRKGRLYDKFGVEQGPGVSDCVLGEHKLLDSVQKTEVKDLDILTTGDRVDNSGELFLKSKMRVLLEEARQHYQYIIIDTAPILATDDTMGLVSYVDQILFVTRSRHSQLRQIRESVDKLRQRRGKIAGLVLNALDTNTPSYQYYKYYDYYSTAPTPKV